MGWPKGRKQSKEHRRKNSEANKGRQTWWRGRKHTPETIAKLRKVSQGPGNGMWGRKHTPKTKAKIAAKARQRTGSRNPFWGRKHTAKTREAIAKNRIEASITISKEKETPQERRVHAALKRLGVRFKCHVPLLERWVADVYIPKFNLILECDGGWHKVINKPGDIIRDRVTRKAGYQVVRITNERIDADPIAAVQWALKKAKR